MENSKSVLRLFKGFIGEKTNDINLEGLKYGLIVPATASDDIFAEAVKLYGKDGKKWNETFHKSWEKVASASIEQLIAEQAMHYFTTYGFESLGVFSSDSVYIPRENLDIPDLEKDVEMIVIHAYAKGEVRKKLMTLLTSGIALSSDTIEDVKELSDLIDPNDIVAIKNREVKVFLYNKYNFVPYDPDEFLRYLIYVLIGNTLKIQDRNTIHQLKSVKREHVLKYLSVYINNYGYESLASVFHRNKNLFLALKGGNRDLLDDASVKSVNKIINKISKLAKKHHIPMPVNILDRLTDVSTDVDIHKMYNLLDVTTPFRELRILNGLSYKLSGNTSYLYKIRNGRSYATVKEKELGLKDHTVLLNRKALLDFHLANRLLNNLCGKKVYIPSNVSYKAPTSEKQFVGNFPSGSSIDIPLNEDLIIGIHWCNIPEGRVDLDLHMQSLNRSFGWNTSYRDQSRRVYFSGDLTDAPLPNGATELFFIGKEIDETFMLSVNNYNSAREIPFEVVIAKANLNKTYTDINNSSNRYGFDWNGIRKSSFMVDPNDIITTIPFKMDSNEKMKRIGFVTRTGDSVKIVFDDFNTASVPVSSNRNEIFSNTIKYLEGYRESSADLKDILKRCGCIFVDNNDESVDYDLSIENLQKDTIISMFNEGVAK